MKRCALVFIVALVLTLPVSVLSQEVISGDKFQAFKVSSASYMNLPVTLEDTYENIVAKFNKIETGNNYAPNLYVKFTLGQCPYTCIGMRVPAVLNSLEKCSRGDLVRVTGQLREMTEKPTRIKTRGRYVGGSAFHETSHVYGPKETELFFSVSKVEKGWGKQDSVNEMFNEGKSLREAHYQEVPIGDIDAGFKKLDESSIWFQGKYNGIDAHFSELAKESGITADKVIKFMVKGLEMPCFVPRSESNIKGFKNLPVDTQIQLYGRIRTKEVPEGVVGAFFVDRMTKTVLKEEPPPSKEKAPAKQEEDAPLSIPEEVPPPPPVP